MSHARGLVALLLCLCAPAAAAEDSWLDSLGKAAGLVAPPTAPPDFVKASRPHDAPETIPAFAPPEEPRSRVKSPAELKTMDADLQRASQGAGHAGSLPKRRAKN